MQEGYASIRAQKAMKQRYHEEYVKRIDPPIQSAVAPWDVFGPAVLIGGRRAYHAAPHLLPTSVTRRISSLADDVGDAAAIHGQAALNHASRYADDAWKGAQSIGRQVGDMADDAVLGGRLAYQDGRRLYQDGKEWLKNHQGVQGGALATGVNEGYDALKDWSIGKGIDQMYNYVSDTYSDWFEDENNDVENNGIDVSD